MPELKWSTTVQVQGGTVLTATGDSRAVEAIDTIEVVLERKKDAVKQVVVDLQPGAATAIHLLAIKSSLYGPDITYKAANDTSDSKPVTLDAPQLFSSGNLALFDLDPHQLKFSNASTDKDATVQILVARDATP
jgi:hypothetical protein